jgi:hypothetical protein
MSGITVLASQMHLFTLRLESESIVWVVFETGVSSDKFSFLA